LPAPEAGKTESRGALSGKTSAEKQDHFFFLAQPYLFSRITAPPLFPKSQGNIQHIFCSRDFTTVYPA
ncbi:MAG: hypothetical protein U0O39_01920, partial [Akkermansia sp.]